MSKACVRCAMGASVLSTMLLIGSSALAVADTESGSDTSGSAGQSQTSDPAASGSTDSSTSTSGSSVRPRFDLRTTLRESVLGGRTARTPLTALRPKSTFDGTSDDTVLGGVDSGETPQPGIPETGEPVTPVAEPTSSTPYSSPTAPPLPNRPSSKVNAGATNPMPLDYGKVLTGAAHTVGNTVFSVLNSTQQTVSAVPTLLAGLPTSTTPVTDVITTLEFMLTSVGNSVGTVASLPGELGALMGVGTVPGPAVGIGPASRTALPVGPVDLPSLMLPEPAAATALTAGALAPAPESPAPLPVTPVHVDSIAPPTVAPLGVSGLAASGAPESFLDRAVSTLLVPISIATLAAVALPGVGGLLVICALGIRIGYRQAKAGWAIRVAGIGRFAGSGPLGVVRSGSMISLHAPRAARTPKPAGLRLVEQPIEQQAA